MDMTLLMEHYMLQEYRCCDHSCLSLTIEFFSVDVVLGFRNLITFGRSALGDRFLLNYF